MLAVWTWPISLPLLWLTDPRRKVRTARQAVASRCSKPGDWELLDEVLRNGEASFRNDQAQDAFSRLRHEGPAPGWEKKDWATVEIHRDWCILEKVIKAKTRKPWFSKRRA